MPGSPWAGVIDWWVLSPVFLQSEEFAILTLAGLSFVGLALPALGECVRHLSLGNLPIGCSFGTLGLVVTGVTAWTVAASVRSARRRFA